MVLRDYGCDLVGSLGSVLTCSRLPFLRFLTSLFPIQAERSTPLDKAAILSTMVAVVVVLNLLKGGGGAFPSPLGLECGSAGYWLLTVRSPANTRNTFITKL